MTQIQHQDGGINKAWLLVQPASNLFAPFNTVPI